LCPGFDFKTGHDDQDAASSDPTSIHGQVGRSDGASVSIEQAVDDVLARLPRNVHLGLPLGLGKPNRSSTRSISASPDCPSGS